MTTHQDLADFIKKVHTDLRLSSRDVGGESAWNSHVLKSELLKDYSVAMKDLATTHWEQNNSNDPSTNRIHWVLKECEDFFKNGGQAAAINKERKMFKKYFNEDLTVDPQPSQTPLKLLDVGSCYNPFRRFDLFDVTAIDIAPATEDVIECDFLFAEVDSTPYLLRTSYDVVLFSFFLGYLPMPKMRYDSCHKAFNLLKPGGILVILTPDSKHDTANSRVMKSWRHGLAHLGFIRTNYAKLKHLRCMTFYKCVEPEIAVKWVSQQTLSFDSAREGSMIIPQDSNTYEDTTVDANVSSERTEDDNKCLTLSFADLAGDDVFAD